MHVGIWAREEELLLDGDGKGPGAPVDPGLVCPALPGPALGETEPEQAGLTQPKTEPDQAGLTQTTVGIKPPNLFSGEEMTER